MRVANENVPPRCTRHILWSSTLNYLGALHLLNLVVEEIYRRVPSGERERGGDDRANTFTRRTLSTFFRTPRPVIHLIPQTALQPEKFFCSSTSSFFELLHKWREICFSCNWVDMEQTDATVNIPPFMARFFPLLRKKMKKKRYDGH